MDNFKLIMLFKSVLFSFTIIVCYAQKEGEPCTSNDGRNGTCIDIARCQSVQSALEKRENPKFCSFDTISPIVCCLNGESEKVTVSSKNKRHAYNEDSVEDYDSGLIERLSEEEECQPIPAKTATRTGQKAFDKCIEYQEKYVYPCVKSVSIAGNPSRANYCHHNVEQLIAGGTEAAKYELPHMVILKYAFDEVSATQICGGAVISEKFVLTAAHCTATEKRVNVSHVVVGALRQSEADEENTYAVKRIIKHPKYMSPIKYNDIALLETVDEIKLSQFVVPACLHVGNQLKDDKVLAAGWGQTGVKDTSSDVLLKVIIEKFTTDDCNQKIVRNRNLAKGVNETIQVCYGHRNVSKDTCQGDSGTPIKIKSEEIECMYTIVGVTSFGKSCGVVGEPAVYTRVSHYVPWIESIVWP